MDFLNKAFAQVSELFKSMTAAARITAGMLLVVIVISLGFLFQRQSSGPDAYLMGGEPFPAAQLPAMEAAFAKANLSAAVIEGNRVRVPRGQQAAYMGALADAGALPPNFGSYLEKALASESPFAMRGSPCSVLCTMVVGTLVRDSLWAVSSVLLIPVLEPSFAA